MNPTARVPFLLVATLVALAAASVAAAPPAAANGILLTPGQVPDGGEQGGPLHLREHRVEAAVRDRVAQVTVEQVFHSSASRPLEGTYLFPLPEGAVVSGFAMTMGGRMVEGEVVDAEQARRIYEDIVRRQRDPGLLEYLGQGLFRARVFPIPPTGDVTIRLAFEQMLEEDAGTLAWRYPLATDRFHGQPVQQVSVDVKVESSVDLKAVYSASHAIEVERDGERKAHVTYAAQARRQATDFLLYLARSPDDVGFSLLTHKRVAEDGTFLLVLAPRTEVAPEDVVPRDVVFVLDTSGSMAGEKLHQAQRSLGYGLETLNEGDRFNIVAFSTALHAFRESLVPVGKDAKKAAVDWIYQLKAEGGTNIEAALSQAVALGAPDRLFLVVFLTDGLPTVGERNADAILAKVQAANTSEARVFTFGVGHDLDVRLLDQVAEATGGLRDYIQPGEDIEVPTGRFFRKVGQPVMTHLALDLGEGAYDVYPPALSDLFAGDQVVVFGRYREAGERTIRLRGRVGDREVEHAYAATFRADEGAAFLPRLWAHKKVAFLLDQIRLHGADPELVDAVRTLAVRHGIVTPYTAGLVVEETEEVHSQEIATPGPRIRDASVRDHVETDHDLPFEEGLSDAPFTGPSRNGLVGLGGGAGGAFAGRGGSRDLTTGGGGRRTTTAVDLSLKWLATHQASDGRFPAAEFGRWCDGRPLPADAVDGAGEASRDVGTTGLALSAFLGAGYTHRGRHPFARVVSKGLRWLKDVQDAEGCFGPRDHADWLVDHAWAALAMVEVYGMTGSPIYRASAQKAIDFLALARRPGGAWGSALRTDPDDPLVTGVVLLPLVSARLVNEEALHRGREAPLREDPEAFAAATAFGVRVPAEGPELPTAIGVLARVFGGADPRRDDLVRRGVRLLAAKPPAWDAGGSVDELYWTFGTLAAFQAGGAEWNTWNEAMKTALLDAQRKDGTFCEAHGSWDPVGVRGAAGGRVLSTALFTICLEVYYRYDRTVGTARPRTPPAQPSPTTGADATRTSEGIRDLKEGVTGGADEGAGLDRVRTVRDRTFALRGDGLWVDTSWDGKRAPTEVEAFSEAYFALLARHPEVADLLAVGERVLFVLGDEVVEIVPPR